MNLTPTPLASTRRPSPPSRSSTASEGGARGASRRPRHGSCPRPPRLPAPPPRARRARTSRSASASRAATRQAATSAPPSTQRSRSALLLHLPRAAPSAGSQARSTAGMRTLPPGARGRMRRRVRLPEPVPELRQLPSSTVLSRSLSRNRLPPVSFVFRLRIRVPYPFEWGAPTFDAGEAFAIMAASFVALVESTGSSIAVSRFASATPLPPSVLSRGVGWQGVGILPDGLFGTGNGSSYQCCTTVMLLCSENAGLLALTCVGSRRVVHISADFMIFFSLLGILALSTCALDQTAPDKNDSVSHKNDETRL